MAPQSIQTTDIDDFNRNGYLVVSGLADQATCDNMLSEIRSCLSPLRGPAEFEVDVRYPGSPDNRLSEGGDTPRRLLHAYGRSQVFRDWSTSAVVGNYLEQLMQSEQVMLSQCHHNCIMTKHPGYSSKTSWHQDIRYWQFDRPELVSVWLALGEETEDNGGLFFIPRSHLPNLDRGRLDKDLFLRTDLEENQVLIDQAICPTLQAGDVVFFHCRTFHAAGMNQTAGVKLSPVFTYHSADNLPIPGTGSSIYPSIAL